jgi:hypothetical protein
MGLGVVVSKRKKMITCFPVWRHWGRNRITHQRGEGIMKDTYDQSVRCCGTKDADHYDPHQQRPKPKHSLTSNCKYISRSMATELWDTVIWSGRRAFHALCRDKVSKNLISNVALVDCQRQLANFVTSLFCSTWFRWLSLCFKRSTCHSSWGVKFLFLLHSSI